MMTNLFSMFDPVCPSMISNWIMIPMLLFFFPMNFWKLKSRYSKTFNVLSSYLFKFKKMNSPKGQNLIIISISVMIFILTINVFSLTPYVFPATSHPSLAISLALTIWLAPIIYAWMYNPYNSLSHFTPISTPSLLIPFMVLIEFISLIIRPLTLTIRLTANITAGHLLMSLMASSILASNSLLLMPLLFSKICLIILESAMAFIQAIVFSTLILLYFDEQIL